MSSWTASCSWVVSSSNLAMVSASLCVVGCVHRSALWFRGAESLFPPDLLPRFPVPPVFFDITVSRRPLLTVGCRPAFGLPVRLVPAIRAVGRSVGWGHCAGGQPTAGVWCSLSGVAGSEAFQRCALPALMARHARVNWRVSSASVGH